MKQIGQTSSRVFLGVTLVIASTVLGACTAPAVDGADAFDSTPDSSADSLSTCAPRAWRAGVWYRTGTVVTFEGNTYVALHGNPGYDPTISTWYWAPKACADNAPAPAPTPAPAPAPAAAPAPAPAPTTGTAFEALVSRSAFDAMFPARAAFYTYDGLAEATKTFPSFATTGTTDDRKREVAAFLANVNHETGSLVYIEEINKSDYCSSSADCPCAPGKQYFGRGPLQLSWNYNYCTASAAIFGDKEVLRLDPDRVAREPRVAWATGLHFWMTSTGAGTMTAHAAMANGSNFGETIRTINGGLECGGRNPAAVQSRVDAYRKFCTQLGVDPGTRTSC
jgi:predicted chitinase